MWGSINGGAFSSPSPGPSNAALLVTVQANVIGGIVTKVAAPMTTPMTVVRSTKRRRGGGDNGGGGGNSSVVVDEGVDEGAGTTVLQELDADLYIKEHLHMLPRSEFGPEAGLPLTHTDIWKLGLPPKDPRGLELDQVIPLKLLSKFKAAFNVNLSLSDVRMTSAARLELAIETADAWDDYYLPSSTADAPGDQAVFKPDLFKVPTAFWGIKKKPSLIRAAEGSWGYFYRVYISKYKEVNITMTVPVVPGAAATAPAIVDELKNGAPAATAPAGRYKGGRRGGGGAAAAVVVRTVHVRMWERAAHAGEALCTPAGSPH
ncbi:hypothetical protein FOA52_003341 [Chlamydomonas sp. UWO 241]|nr:hypothetical protein FOA52_003341 [Chlamydomonas sp. UWO 241]